jgi:hypothetical protein
MPIISRLILFVSLIHFFLVFVDCCR